jgi:cell division septation protein DedD
VQAGAFNIRENAQVLIQQLRSRGYTAAIVGSVQGPRYRVWVGGDLDRPAAERLAAALRADGFDAALIAR